MKCTADPSCGPFNLYRPLNYVEGEPACPKCGAKTATDWAAWSRPTNHHTADPVVVYQAADGTYRFPGKGDGLYAKSCEQQGMTRVELRGWADVRKFEGKVNAQELSKINRRVERQQRAIEIHERARRSDLTNAMRNGFQIPETDDRGNRTGRMKTVHLSPRMRDVADKLIAMNNRKRVSGYDPGFFVDAFSMNRGNRDASRDERGRRLRD